MLQDPIGPDTGQIRCMAQPSGWPPLLPTGRRYRQSSCGPGPLICVGMEKRQMQTNEDTKRRMDWVILARGYVCKGVIWKMASRNTSMWGLFVQMLYMVRRGGEKEEKSCCIHMVQEDLGRVELSRPSWRGNEPPRWARILP